MRQSFVKSGGKNVVELEQGPRPPHTSRLEDFLRVPGVPSGPLHEMESENSAKKGFQKLSKDHSVKIGCPN